MNIDITGRHFHVTEGLRDHALAKMTKLDKYTLKIESAHVVFEVQKFHQVCEIVLTGKHIRMTALEKSADIYASFDQAVANLQKQLARYHEKLKSHHKKDGNDESEDEIPAEKD